MNWRLRAESLDVKDLEGLKGFLARHGVSHVITNDEWTPRFHQVFQELMPKAGRLEARIGMCKLWLVHVPRIRVSPPTIDFGTVAIGTVSGHTVTVWNEGTADLTVSRITLSGSSPHEYREPVLCSGTALPPGSSCTVKVRFKPTRPGAADATLVVASDALNKDVGTVSLSGTGTP